MGMTGIKISGRKGCVVVALIVALGDEIGVAASGGATIWMPVREISSQGRVATGVRVMTLESGQVVTSVAPFFVSDEA